MAMSMVLILTLAMKHYQHVIIHVHMFTIFFIQNFLKIAYDHIIMTIVFPRNSLGVNNDNNWTSEYSFKVPEGLKSRLIVDSFAPRK